MPQSNFFDAPIPKSIGDKIIWQHQIGSGTSLALTHAAIKSDGPIIIVTNSSHQAHQMERELKLFCRDTGLHVQVFPDWETLPYDAFSPHQDIISERLATLVALNQLTKGLCIVPVTTMMHQLMPKSHLLASSLVMSEGDKLNLTTMSQQLVDSCYRKVAEVNEHGEFAIRGSILDIFPMGADWPIRVELFDDEIETLRYFDPQNQRSKEKLSSIKLLPGREIPLGESSVKTFRKKWRETFEGNPKLCHVYEDISQHIIPPGIEYYLPLFFDEVSQFADFCPSDATFVLMSDLQEPIDALWRSVTDRYEQYRHDRLKPILAPNQIFLTSDQFFTAIKPFKQIQIKEVVKDKPHHYHFDSSSFPDLSINHKLENPLSNLTSFIAQSDCKVLLCAESKGRRESLKDLLAKQRLQPDDVQNVNVFFQDSTKFGLAIAPIDVGFYSPSQKLIMIAEAQLYGTQVMQRRRRRKTQVVETDFQIKHIAELKIGDPMVHIEFGVGRYLGLKTIHIENKEAEFLEIQYAGTDKLYVPVSSLHLISKFTGSHADHVPLNKLGTDQWDKAKSKALKKAQDVAAELLEIYAKRKAKPGRAFKSLEEPMTMFASQFPFEETPDQLRAIDEVLADMQSPTPMDRLICGDVGFGKTEVAMRATFMAAFNEKQVAILVPTTLLAQQHYETFLDRFAEWPLTVEVLSRFKTKKEQDKIIDKIKAGTVDIIIGTHKLIQSEISFKRLGLVVIDEEHRFGVKQKEQLKKMRSEVDILTLTATPIPRTLNMAFANLRDLSIIATPPKKRLSINTFVREKGDPLITEAIMRELMRGGQVYYLHNAVDTIEKTANHISKLVPQARVGIAHGQMRERELEGIMADFYHQRFNVLVCTTIIETGIDIPSANTIIIDRADKLGLAQLHQLRGRVGRSHHQAYAYCLTPPKKQLTSDATKRLEALEALTELGSGFSLASQDLEIRGAGELLGEGQSGDIHTIGFSLYMDILNKAVKALQNGEPFMLEDSLNQGAEIDLNITSLIPESYIHDVSTRLLLYKRISHANSDENLNELKIEMIDRFGLLPEAVNHLFRIAQLKIKVASMGIKKIDASASGGRIIFTAKPNINTTSLIEMIRTKPLRYQIKGSELFKFTMDMPQVEDRFQTIEHLIEQLNPLSMPATS